MEGVVDTLITLLFLTFSLSDSLFQRSVPFHLYLVIGLRRLRTPLLWE